MSYIFDASTPISPEKKKLAQAMLQRKQMELMSPGALPTTIGGGIAALGQGFANGLELRSLRNQANAPTDAWGDMRQVGQNQLPDQNGGGGVGFLGGLKTMFGGGQPAGAPTGLSKPDFPAAPPQPQPQPQPMGMQPLPSLGQPAIPAAPTGQQMAGNVEPSIQSVVPPGVTPMAGDTDPVSAAAPVPSSMGNVMSPEVPSVSDAVKNAFARIFGPPA